MEKINSRLEFPMELNLTQFTKKLANALPEYYKYELLGTIVHSGYAKHGQYITWFKHLNKWIRADNEEIKHFKTSQGVLEESYGEEEHKESQAKSASLLIYRRKRFLNEQSMQCYDSLYPHLSNLIMEKMPDQFNYLNANELDGYFEELLSLSEHKETNTSK